MKFTRKFRIITVTYAIAGILVLTGLAISNYCRLKSSEIQLTNTYRRAFTSAVNGVNEISTALEKSVYGSLTLYDIRHLHRGIRKSRIRSDVPGRMPFPLRRS